MAESPCRRESTAPETATAERRKAVRFACLTECLVRIEGAELGEDWPGMAYNVSATGIALALAFPVPVGSVLVIERRSPRRGSRPKRARVVRCRLEQCVWSHGCAFTERLSDDELQTWAPLPLEDRFG